MIYDIYICVCVIYSGMMIFQTHLEGSGSLTASKGAALSEAEALVVTGKLHGNRVVSLNQPLQNSNE